MKRVPTECESYKGGMCLSSGFILFLCRNPWCRPNVVNCNARRSMVPHRSTRTFTRKYLPILNNRPFFRVISRNRVNVIRNPYLLRRPSTPIRINKRTMLRIMKFCGKDFNGRNLVTSRRTLLRTSPNGRFQNNRTTRTSRIAFLIRRFHFTMRRIK